MIHQRHLRNRFLKVQGTSTFAIVNPERLICRDKINKAFKCTQDSVSDNLPFLPDS